MKTRHYISVIIICLGIGGLTFTSLFFYNYNTRIVMVEEVQEETGEDISQLESCSGTHFHPWKDLIAGSAAVKFHANIFLSRQALYTTSKGYFLDLIKPPIL